MARFWSEISQMILEVEKSWASQLLVTSQPERPRLEPQLAARGHPAGSSSGSSGADEVQPSRLAAIQVRQPLLELHIHSNKEPKLQGSGPTIGCYHTCEAFELSFFKLTVLPTKSICMIVRSKSIDKLSPDFYSSHCLVHYSLRSGSEFFTHCTL